MTSQVVDFQFWNNIAATPDTFRLMAGAFGLTLHATTWGSADLQKMLPDGATYVTVATLTADGYQEIHLPAGEYRLNLAGVTGLVGEIAKIAGGH